MPIILAIQEDRGSKPAQANSSTTPYLEKPFTKIELMEWLKVKAKFKAQYYPVRVPSYY
jgi:hypothetical protein